MRDKVQSSGMSALVPGLETPFQHQSWLLFPMEPRHSGQIQRLSSAQEPSILNAIVFVMFAVPGPIYKQENEAPKEKER